MTDTRRQTVSEYVDSHPPTMCGRLAYYLLPYRRRVVLRNMNIAFGKELSVSQIKRLAQSYYGHLLKSLKENFLMHCLPLERTKNKVTVKGAHHVQEALEKNKGLLLLTGHMGNWEFAPIAGIMQFELLKGRFYFLRRELKAKWIEQLLFRRYYKHGLKVLAGKNRVERACDVIVDNNAVVFVMDQNAQTKFDGSKDGIPSPFFGKLAGTYRSLAIVQGYTKAPVLPVTAYRQPDGMHVLEFGAEVLWQVAETTRKEIELNTAQYNLELERMIRQYPEQWNWIHKRWKPVS